MLLLNKLVVLLESLRLSVPTTSFILTAPTGRKASALSAPAYKVAAALLPPTVVLVTWAVLSSHRDAPRPLPATRLQVADIDNTLYPSVTFAPVCSIDSYDGPDEGLRRVAGRCDVRFFFESPKPIPAKPPTCSLAAYGPDLALRRENGVCDFNLPIFLPEPGPDAQTAHVTLFFRVLDSLPSDPHQVMAHLSDRLRSLSLFLRDWPTVHALFGKVRFVLNLVAVAVGTSVSHIRSVFDVQAFKHLLLGHGYSPLQAQLLLETARQTTDLVLKLRSGSSGVLFHVVEQIFLLCPSSESIEALHAKVDWIVILPLLRRLAQLLLALVLVISFYVGYRRLQVTHSFFNTFSRLHCLLTKASEV